MKHMLLAQQQSSDQWAFYQAKVIREHLYRAQALVMQAELADTAAARGPRQEKRSEEHTSELQSLAYLVCRLLLEKKKKKDKKHELTQSLSQLATPSTN